MAICGPCIIVQFSFENNVGINYKVWENKIISNYLQYLEKMNFSSKNEIARIHNIDEHKKLEREVYNILKATSDSEKTIESLLNLLNGYNFI